MHVVDTQVDGRHAVTNDGADGERAGDIDHGGDWPAMDLRRVFHATVLGTVGQAQDQTARLEVDLVDDHAQELMEGRGIDQRLEVFGGEGRPLRHESFLRAAL